MEIATKDGNSRGNETGGNRESTGEDRLSGRSLAHFLPLPRSIYISVYIYICISLDARECVRAESLRAVKSHRKRQVLSVQTADGRSLGALNK